MIVFRLTTSIDSYGLVTTDYPSITMNEGTFTLFSAVAGTRYSVNGTQRQELEKERQQIAQTRQSIDQQKYDLEAREAKLQSIQPLIPSVKELQAMGVTFDLLIPYLMTVNEKAVTENIDLKTAAYKIVHDFREYRDLESLHKSVEKVKQQLEVLQVFTVQQAAVATVMNLQVAGFSEKEIVELTAFVGRWNKQWPSLGGPRIGQGSSSMNGSKLDDRLIGH